MSRVVWRIGSDTPDYTAEDLTGKGAEVTGGRWNRKGLPVVYTATSAALAALETIVHLNGGGLPLNRYLVRIEIPDDVWAARRTSTAMELPLGWECRPAGKVSLDIGDEWLRTAKTALFEVPSVIVPEETNLLINPQHKDASMIQAVKVRQWLYDARIQR